MGYTYELGTWRGKGIVPACPMLLRLQAVEAIMCSNVSRSLYMASWLHKWISSIFRVRRAVRVWVVRAINHIGAICW